MSLYDGVQIELITTAGETIKAEAERINNEVVGQLDTIFNRGISKDGIDRDAWTSTMRMLSEISIISQGITARCKDMLTMCGILRDLCQE